VSAFAALFCFSKKAQAAAFDVPFAATSACYNFVSAHPAGLPSIPFRAPRPRCRTSIMGKFADFICHAWGKRLRWRAHNLAGVLARVSIASHSQGVVDSSLLSPPASGGCYAQTQQGMSPKKKRQEDNGTSTGLNMRTA